MGSKLGSILVLAVLAAVPVAVTAAGGSASEAYMQAGGVMCEAMGAPMSGDPDMDFARMMKAHHQGAIDMAKVEMEHGSDPRLRAMAEAIVAAQTKEIQELDAWLRARTGTR